MVVPVRVGVYSDVRRLVSVLRTQSVCFPCALPEERQSLWLTTHVQSHPSSHRAMLPHPQPGAVWATHSRPAVIKHKCDHPVRPTAFLHPTQRACNNPSPIDPALLLIKTRALPAMIRYKRDPNEPAEEKRKSVESQGKKPLGPEHHQWHWQYIIPYPYLPDHCNAAGTHSDEAKACLDW